MKSPFLVLAVVVNMLFAMVYSFKGDTANVVYFLGVAVVVLLGQILITLEEKK